MCTYLFYVFSVFSLPVNCHVFHSLMASNPPKEKIQTVTIPPNGNLRGGSCNIGVGIHRSEHEIQYRIGINVTAVHLPNGGCGGNYIQVNEYNYYGQKDKSYELIK